MEIGVTRIDFEGHLLTIFDRDRTICDVIRYENKMDKEVFNKAIKAYVSDSDKNIGNLFEYTNKLGVKRKVEKIIGMWL